MVFEEIQRIIAEKLGLEIADVTMECSLSDDLDADSLDIMDIIASVEETFDIRVPEDDLLEMKKVSDLVTYIEGMN